MINVTSLQRDEQGKDEKITLETPGIYGEKDGMKYVTYQETELAGMKGTTTTLQIYEDHVNLVREGNFLQNQEYRIGKKSQSLYRTPMGSMEISIVTREIEDTIQDGIGKMRLSYDVELKGLFSHLNEIIVEIWEDPEHPWKSEKS